MPIYEFQCQNCKKIFETILMNSSQEAQKDLKCPSCFSQDLKKAVSATNLNLSSRSSQPLGPPSIGGCGGGSGFS